MVAIDTNVLLRLLINDDELQASKARSLFETQADGGEFLWVADIVLIELVWALDRRYGRPRDEVCAALNALTNNATVVAESSDCLHQAIALYEQGPAGFADCLLAVKAGMAGCNALRTFDKKMRALPGVKLL